jgi:uncharacterized protein (DUF1015 family)
LAEIRPFHGIYYNRAQVKDLADVLCPPFDIITPRMQQELYDKSRFNFIRLEFGRELFRDSDTDNRYTRAAATLNNWLVQGVLKIDKSPALYIHDHHYTHRNRRYRLRSITCVVKLEEWDTGVIRPHESTSSSPKGDRLNLLWTLHANTSPVLALYDGRDIPVSTLLNDQCRGAPSLSSDIRGGEAHNLWAIKNKQAVSQICSLFENQPLYIADGHHRYESALTYRREKRSTSASSLSPDSDEPYDFVMMTLVDITDPGLLILPAHRLIRGLPPSAINKLLPGLKTFFDVDEVRLDDGDTNKQIDKLLSGKTATVQIVLYGLKKDSLHLLELHDFSGIAPMMPHFHSELYQKLDVSIVNHVILEELLGIEHDKTAQHLDYRNNASDAINAVSENEYQLAVLLNPVRPEVIKAIADSGDRMPRKSTYFYPKTPTGLVFYRFG